MKLTSEKALELAMSKLIYFGVSEEDARKAAEVLIEAEMRGDPSHGLSCLSTIIKSIIKKEIIPDKKPRIIDEKNAVAVLDGENVLGPVSAIFAIDLAMKKAKEFGVSAVSVRKSQHLFTLGYYTKIAASNNFIGIATTATAPAMFAPGGLEKVLGTNPFSIGIPSEKYPVVVDMSSTNVARGKIKEAGKKNTKIPPHWALDKNGKFTEDPNEALEGSLQPLGGYKGFALALAIDILSGILSGSASGKEIFGTSMHVHDSSKKTAYKGDLFVLIDISKFADVNVFKSRVSNLIREIKNSRKIEGVDEIYIPGERASKSDERFIELDDGAYDEIEKL